MEYAEGLRRRREQYISEIQAIQSKMAYIDELLQECATGSTSPSQGLVVSHFPAAQFGRVNTDVVVQEALPESKGRGRNHVIAEAVTKLLRDAASYELHIDKIRGSLSEQGLETERGYLFSVLSRNFKPVRKGSGLWTLPEYTPDESEELAEQESTASTTQEDEDSGMDDLNDFPDEADVGGDVDL